MLSTYVFFGPKNICSTYQNELGPSPSRLSGGTNDLLLSEQIAVIPLPEIREPGTRQ